MQVLSIAQLLGGASPITPKLNPPYNLYPARAIAATDASRLMSGRVLAQCHVTEIGKLLELIDGRPSGLVLTGIAGAKAAYRVRKGTGVD